MSSKLVAKIDDGDTSNFSLSATWLLLDGVHLIAWKFPFLTETEKILWHVASLVLAGSPILSFLSIFTFRHNDGVIEKISTAFFIIALIVGVVSRALLIGLMLASLRALPPSTYETVAWTAYIPHL